MEFYPEIFDANYRSSKVDLKDNYEVTSFSKTYLNIHRAIDFHVFLAN